MKYLLIIIIVLPFLCHAQSDSIIQSKLLQYKTMYQDSLISESEYTKLKQDLLFPSIKSETPVPVKNTKETTESLKYYKISYLSQLTGGSIFIGGGIALMILGGNQRKNKIPNATDYVKGTKVDLAGYNSAVANYKRLYKTYFSAGGVALALGIILDGLGINNKRLYENKKKSMGVGLSDENLGLKLSF